jgi:hypothetical protein
MKRTLILVASLAIAGGCKDDALDTGDGGATGGAGGGTVTGGAPATGGSATGGGNPATGGGAATGGSKADGSAATPDVPAGSTTCGTATCAPGLVCCNASCGICTRPGEGCIKLLCQPDAGAGAGACKVNDDCRLFDDYCTGCDCRALAKTDPDPKCSGPGVRCTVQPCANKQAICEAGRCVVRAGSAAATRWFYGCGDPVCRGWTEKPDVPRCTVEKEAAPCATAGARCDPRDDCNRLLVCADSDPTMGPVGCPRSRREVKQEIRYLGPEELRRYSDDLLRLRLATWRYKNDPARPRLGFIIDDVEAGGGGAGVAVDGSGATVDLYGYTSLAVASLQRQAQEIAALRAELDELRRELAAVKTGRPRPQRRSPK